jgi:hypothetical protein
MFEPLKLITAGIAAVLLAPFCFVFWQMTTYRPRPVNEGDIQGLQAKMEAQAGTTQPDASVVVAVKTVSVEAIGLFRARWLSFFPQRWVGALGLIAAIFVFLCVIISLFFPGEKNVVVREWTLPPSTVK